MNPVHQVYVNDQLQYEFLESMWYDTASPAQACIRQLKEIEALVPNVVVVSYGKKYLARTKEEFVAWVKDVFSPTGTSYECDFSLYL